MVQQAGINGIQTLIDDLTAEIDEYEALRSR
jgi:hypothetical protein